MKEYKHTQIGYFLLSVYSISALFIGCLYIAADLHPLALVAVIILLIAIGFFATLTVQVDGRMIKIRLGLGVIRKSFLLKDIKIYRVVRNPWYYGWGVRYTPRGWLFGVSGLSAIELQMKDGKLYRIGTDDAEKFANALDEALKDSSVH